MRGSIAKRLRRITKHDPNNTPTYIERVSQRAAAVPFQVDPKGFITVKRVTVLLAGSDRRAVYQRAKKLYRVNKALFAKHVFQVGI